MLKNNRLLRSLLTGLVVLVALVIYAYGFEVTQVSLEETRSERRQVQLVRIVRALAQPEILEYEKEEFNISIPFMIPCPPGGFTAPAPDTSGPYVVITPACADPNTEVRVEGFNLEPDTTGPLNLYPVPDVPLPLGRVTTDSSGHFEMMVKLPRQRTSETPMEIRATTRRNVGLPFFSHAAKDTWEKIIETVFLALLATTFGTLAAVPLSFLAARNLMKDVNSPLSSVALSIITMPIGFWLGGLVNQQVNALGLLMTSNSLFALLGLIASLAAAFFLARWALPQEEENLPSLPIRLARGIALLIAGLLGILSLALLASLMMSGGKTLSASLGGLAFLSNFAVSLGEILEMLVGVILSLAGAALLGAWAGRIGVWTAEKLSVRVNKVLGVLLATLAGAVLLGLFGMLVIWLYELPNPNNLLANLGLTGAVLGGLFGLRLKPTAPLPVGMVVYTITRTILNGLRSIESLVMVIVFAVWVGIGPFAGVLALALHTIASSAKLYSEQVEGIMAGPLEAIQATGATRLQTIMYAVIPQIIPPYISLTMYRWDINVRMSTIIGFAGGGGIGFLLQQNINLLNYRAASVQMLAIAVVVSLMDYVSSKMRERVM